FRFLKVHDAENQVAGLNSQISVLRIQIPKYDKVQQERAAILGLASISNPIVQDEVYWPGVLTALGKSTPAGGTIPSFQATAVPRPVAGTAGKSAPTPPPSAIQIASLSISLLSPTGYTYFHSWYYSVDGSGKLTVNAFGGITQTGACSASSASSNVTFTATVGVTGEVTSIRANEFQVPR